MQKKKVFILLGHSDKETLNGALANSYENGAKEGEHEVRRMNIGDLNFDPVLHKGYKTVQELEPDLKQVQDNIKWCEHLVILYPIWHGGPPAILKGLFDRVFLPGFAFRFYKSGLGWEKLLRGRTSRVIVTSGSFPFLARLMFGDHTNEIRKNLLGFAGIKVKMTQLGHAEKISEAKFKRWRGRVFNLGQDAK